jgi:putative transposase
MPRRHRVSAGGIAFHIINRRVGRMEIFESEAEYLAFEEIMAQACQRVPMRVLGYCLMPNHWHLVLWPRKDRDLSKFMQWLTVTHTRRWHVARRSIGEGALYQGRFKSFPIEADDHLLSVLRYVERNPLRGKLVRRAENWRWSSLSEPESDHPWLTVRDDWPAKPPRNWIAIVNEPQTDAELARLRRSVNRGSPFGDDRWGAKIAKQLGLESSLRSPGRPRKMKKVKSRRVRGDNGT